MVKHGRNKKRRAGRIGRTKLKNHNYARWNPKPKITDPTVKKLWDVTKSPQQNLAAMGLTLTPNAGALVTSASSTVNTTNTTSDTPNNKPNMIELFDIPESDLLAPATKRLPLNQQNQEYIVQCMAKHGTDYRKMFRDIKLNKLQHTHDKLQKMAARFLLLEPDQLRIPLEDIPDHIVSKMQHCNELLEQE